MMETARVPVPAWNGSTTPAAAAWTVADVTAWLGANKLARYAEAFAGCDVDGLTLLQVRDEQDCEELGVTLRVHRRKLLALLASLVRALQPSENDDVAAAPGLSTPSPPSPPVPPSHGALEPEPTLEPASLSPPKRITVKVPIHPGSGLGLELAASHTGDCIVATITSATASAQGLQEGDVLVAVDAVDVATGTGFRLEDIVSLLRSKVKAQRAALSLDFLRGKAGKDSKDSDDSLHLHNSDD